jgi:hypothetical protein
MWRLVLITRSISSRKGTEIGMIHGGRRLRVDGNAPGGFVGGFVQPGGQEGMEVAAIFSGEAAFFIRCCPEPIQELTGILVVGADITSK